VVTVTVGAVAVPVQVGREASRSGTAPVAELSVNVTVIVLVLAEAEDVDTDTAVRPSRALVRAPAMSAVRVAEVMSIGAVCWEAVDSTNSPLKALLLGHV
jgi:hypothetical protein